MRHKCICQMMSNIIELGKVLLLFYILNVRKLFVNFSPIVYFGFGEEIWLQYLSKLLSQSETFQFYSPLLQIKDADSAESY